MATENQLEEILRRYLEEVPVFANDKAKAIGNGLGVSDEISVTLKNACGHPTASLTRSYSHPDKTCHPLRSTFDIKLVQGEWKVRCSSGLPGGRD